MLEEIIKAHLEPTKGIAESYTMSEIKRGRLYAFTRLYSLITQTRWGLREHVKPLIEEENRILAQTTHYADYWGDGAMAVYVWFLSEVEKL